MSAQDIIDIKANIKTLYGKIDTLTETVVRLTTIAEVQKLMNRERLVYIGLLVTAIGYIVQLKVF